MKTKFLSKEDALSNRKWHVVDAAGVPLGRLATRVAGLIRGKQKPSFTPHTDCGDFVIVVNADQVVLTGKKLDQKVYRRHSHYLGGLKEVVADDLLAAHPDRVIAAAVKGMLPRGRLGRDQRSKLKVYKGSEHPHSAQMPRSFDVRAK